MYSYISAVLNQLIHGFAAGSLTQNTCLGTETPRANLVIRLVTRPQDDLLNRQLIRKWVDTV